MSVHCPRLERVDTTAAACLMLAADLFKSGEFSSALAEVNWALRENPELAEAHHLKGLVLTCQRDWDGAEACLEQATRLDPDRPDAWTALAAVRKERGCLEGARAAVDRAVALGSSEAKAHLLRGRICAALGQPDEAVSAYGRAIRCDPQLHRARYELVRLLLDSGELDSALGHATEAVHLASLDPQSHLLLGDVLRRRRAFDAAISSYYTAAELAPAEAVPLVRIGEMLFEDNRPAEARAALQQALARDPRHVNCCITLGRIYRRLHRYREAAEMFRAAGMGRAGGGGRAHQ